MLDLSAAPSLQVGISGEAIIQLYKERKANEGQEIDRMRTLRDHYNGDIVIPLPEMDKQEQAFTANIIANGLDQTAQRISSTLPTVWYPPVDNANDASRNRARTRTLATQGWWTYNDMSAKLRLRSRRLIGYASSPVSLTPDFKAGCAKWRLRDPMATYPSSLEDATDMTPDDCIFAYKKTRGWLKNNYPNTLMALDMSRQYGTQASSEDTFTVIEYQDAEVTVMLVMSLDSQLPSYKGLEFLELERVINRAGIPLVVTPGRFNLDKPRGQYDDLVGMNYAMAKLMAYELIFAGKSVFPEKYLESDPGQQAMFVSGPHAASSGMVNIIQNGKMREVNVSPGFAGTQMISNLERNMRVTGGIAPEMGGESQTNVRTGKRGDSIMSAVIDFPVQEAQEILQLSLQHENKRAVAIAKNYFGNEKKSFYITSKGSLKGKGHIDYTPNKDFESDNNIVSYPQTGVDANGLVVGGGQRVAMGTMSKKTFMEQDPAIDDYEAELEQIEIEQMREAIMVGLTQQLTTGALPANDGARIAQLILDKVPLEDAITKAHEEAQARQATPAPANSPATQPGLSLPGMGAESPAIPQGPPSQQNLAQVLSQIKTNAGGA